ncbi:MAG: metalloprotease ybeY [Gemmatimonadetes bacterium]|nr:metalloprotease ybeY [Gemmatimonadota bacterium]
MSPTASRLIVDVSAEGVRVPVALSRVRDACVHVLTAERIRDALVSIAFVTERRIAALNREHLDHRGPTDVISFGFAPTVAGSGLVGDIYICPAVARANAVSAGERIRDELLRLVVHGALHVIGYEHPDAGDRYASPMWKRQERIVRQILRAG